MRTFLLAVAIVFAVVGVAVAYQYPMVPYTNATGPMIGFNGPMVPSGSGGGGPPAGCNGTADFSDGCAVAVFH